MAIGVNAPVKNPAAAFTPLAVWGNPHAEECAEQFGPAHAAAAKAVPAAVYLPNPK
jgi:hypothetical protein